MRVISKTRLKEFWETHPSAETPLAAWHQIVSAAEWRSWPEVSTTYPRADLVGRLTVFDIGGNKFRLIARIEFALQRVYIRGVMTHAEYDKEDWKHDPWF